MGYVLTLPDGAYAAAGANQANIAAAATITALNRIKADVLKNAATGNYNVTLWGIERAASDMKLQGGIYWVSGTTVSLYSVDSAHTLASLGGGTGTNPTLDTSTLSAGEYLWITLTDNPGGSPVHWASIRKADGTQILDSFFNGFDVALDTGDSRGEVVLGNSLWFRANSGLVKATTHDGFALFNRAISAAEEWAVPNPSGSGVLRSTGFSDGSGSAITDDTPGALGLTSYDSLGTPTPGTWAAGGVWDAPSAANPVVLRRWATPRRGRR